MIVDFSRETGNMKIMHAVNNGPMRKKPDQVRDNFDSYKALNIPYARNHDASFNSDYGGCHTVDVHYIFPDFNAPVDDPASYDFVLTDQYIENTLAAGTETFYRLGTKIEHEKKKYGTLPPPDFQKWAEICEHIIRHMNYGWADGHEYGITYWEIWNEPDIASDNTEPFLKKCWGGTEAQFHDFFEVAAKHLKKCFPELKIGGPAVCNPGNWLERFLEDMQKRNVPMDFVSWHGYTTDPANVKAGAERARSMMNRYGYTEAESIYNEWNYVEGWTDTFVASIEAIIGARGAAFSAACMINGQNSPVDMMMYYDARPCVFNGLWDFYTARELHGYYPFLAYQKLYAMGKQVEVTETEENIYAVASTDSNGNNGLLISAYCPDKNEKFSKNISIELKGIKSDKAQLTITDKDNKCLKREILITEGLINIDVCENTVVFAEF